MARKGTQPALYELIRPRGEARTYSYSGAAPSPRTEHVPAPSLSVGAPSTPSAPPRVVRMPVGYIYGAVAFLLFAIVASYMYGVSVGDRLARDRREQARLDEMNAASRMPEVDPLAAGKVPPSLAGAQGTKPPANRDPGPAESPRTPANGSDLGPAPGTDPRQPGLNYFVIAHTATRNGQAMVDFCRQNGLDAHLVPDDNGELRLVIVAPGFSSGQRRDRAVTDLEANIRSVGLRWKNAARGNRDFGDAYPSKYQPR
ncbi:MAG: hypothetical protein U0572_15925 [Phycisphaerales bacterium]